MIVDPETETESIWPTGNCDAGWTTVVVVVGGTVVVVVVALAEPATVTGDEALLRGPLLGPSFARTL